MKPFFASAFPFSLKSNQLLTDQQKTPYSINASSLKLPASFGGWKDVEWLGAHTALPEDPDSGLSTHVAAYLIHILKIKLRPPASQVLILITQRKAGFHTNADSNGPWEGRITSGHPPCRSTVSSLHSRLKGL